MSHLSRGSPLSGKTIRTMPRWSPSLRVVIDGGAEVFQITACPAWIASVLSIAAARRTGYTGERHSAPKFIQSRDARAGIASGWRADARNHRHRRRELRHVDRVKITSAAIRTVFFRRIGR